MWLQEQLESKGGVDAACGATGIPKAFMDKYISMEYHLEGPDLTKVSEFLGITEDDAMSNHITYLFSNLYALGMKVFTSDTMSCGNFKVVEKGDKVSLHGTHTKSEFSSVPRALEYMLRAVRGEVRI